MKKVTILITGILLSGFYLLTNRKEAANQNTPYIMVPDSSQIDKNLALLKTKCYICHNPSSNSHDELLAPPMAAVKMRYNMQFPEKEQFIDHMNKFMLDPGKENAIMFGAVEKFGVMPKILTDEKVVRDIVTYIHENELEKPEWFQRP